MKIDNFTVKTIQAEEGKYLTQAQDVDILNRLLTQNKIFLAVLDSPDNWKEIDEEEAEAIRKAQAEAKAELEQQKQG